MTDKKEKLIVFTAGLALRLFLFFSILILNPYHLDFFNNPNYQGSDQGVFFKIVKNVVDHQAFSFSNQAPYQPDMFRTPLFPLFVAPSYWLTGGTLLFAILNMLLSALTAIFVYEIADQLFNDRRVAFWSGLIFALLPYGAYLSLMVMADNLFTLFFVLAILFFVKFFKKPTGGELVEPACGELCWAGFWLGLATLTRPITQYLFILIAVLVLVFALSIGAKKRNVIGWLWALVFSFLLTISPWVARNYIVFRTPELSSLAGYHMFVSWVGPYRAYFKDHVSRSEEENKLYAYIKQKYGKYGSEAMYDLPISTSLGNEAKKEIQQNLFTYVPFHLLSGLIYYANNDVILTLSEVFHVNSGNIYVTEKLIKHDWFGLANSLLKLNFFYILVYFLSYLLIFSKNILALVGLIKNWRSQPWVMWLFLMILVYFPLIVGPEGHARFRYPVEPILIILAVWATSNVCSHPERSEGSSANAGAR